MYRRLYRQVLIAMIIIMVIALTMRPLLVLLPMGLVFAVPMLSVVFRRYLGLAPTFAMLFALSMVFFIFISTDAMAFCLLIILPSSLIAIWADKKLAHFSLSVALICGALFVGSIAGLMLMHYFTEGDFLTPGVETLVRTMSQSGIYPPDWLLRFFTAGGPWEFTDAARAQTLEIMGARAVEFLRVIIPARVVSGCIWGSVLAVFLPRARDRRRGKRQGDYPELGSWFLPVSLRIGLLALFLLGVLGLILRVEAHMAMYFSLYALIETAYALEGLGLLWWRLHKKGRPWWLCVLLSILLFFFLRFALFLLGLFDQFVNPRRLNMNKIPTNEEDAL